MPAPGSDHRDSARSAARLATAGALLGTCWLVATWLYWEPRVHPGLDEIFTTLTARRGVIGAWPHALVYQSQPPLYYLMAALAWVVQPSLTSVRVVSLIGAVVAVWSMVPLGRFLRLGRGTFWLALSCAALPIVQAYSYEGRVYSWMMAVVLLHLCSILWLVSRSAADRARGPSAAVVVSAVCAMLMFYYAGAVVALALGSALLLWPAHRRILWRSIGVITLLMLPWLPVIRRQLMVIAGNYPMMKVAGPTDGIGIAREMLARGVVGAPIAERPGVLVLFLVTILVAGVLLARPGDVGRADADPTGSGRDDAIGVDRRRRTQLVFLTSVGTVLLLLVLRESDAIMVFPRYLSMVVPLLAAGIAGAVGCAGTGRRRVPLAALGVALVALLQLSYLRNVQVRPDHRPAATLVASRKAPAEPVLISDPVSTLLFLHEYPGRVVTLPVDTNTARFRMADRLVDPLRVSARIDSAVTGAPGVWWVRLTSQTEELDRLDAIVAARTTGFRVVLDTTVAPYRVRHLLPR